MKTAREFPCVDSVCPGELSHEKGACRECGARPCAYCTARSTRRWQPPELANYYISVCAACYEAARVERAENVLARVGKKREVAS